jgi:hypothetical protein
VDDVGEFSAMSDGTTMNVKSKFRKRNAEGDRGEDVEGQ